MGSGSPVPSRGSPLSTLTTLSHCEGMQGKCVAMQTLRTTGPRTPAGMLRRCPWAQDAAAQKRRKESALGSGLQDHRYRSVTKERHGDASGQAANTQTSGAQRNVKDRRQAATIGPVSPTDHRVHRPQETATPEAPPPPRSPPPPPLCGLYQPAKGWRHRSAHTCRTTRRPAPARTRTPHGTPPTEPEDRLPGPGPVCSS